MKKLMLGVVALAAGAAMAIESENVVGYSQTPACGGYSIGTVQFVNVNGENSFALTSLKPAVEGADGCVSISTIDEEGYTADTYIWAEWSEEEIGWVNDDMEFIDDSVVFDAGTAFWIQNDMGETVGMQSAGSVGAEDVNLPINSGYCMAGNPFPCDVKMMDILVKGEGADGCVSISTIDEEGYTLDTYIWAEWSEEEIGWVNDDMEFVDETEVVTPGSAFWVQCDLEDGAELYIPAPEL